MRRLPLTAGACLALGWLAQAVAAESVCRPLPDAEAWLARQAPSWRLSQYPGYVPPQGVRVCLARSGSPRAQLASNRIDLRSAGGPDAATQDRLSLVHEYLHLAFKQHPSGADEPFIESLARRLVLEVETP